MSMDNIFGIAGTALNAQLTRMNATASNLANAGTVAGPRMNTVGAYLTAPGGGGEMSMASQFTHATKTGRL